MLRMAGGVWLVKLEISGGMSMDIKELLEYIQENLDDDCLTMQSKVYILDEWGDTNPVINIKNDCNELTLSSPWADTQHTYDPDKVVANVLEKSDTEECKWTCTGDIFDNNEFKVQCNHNPLKREKVPNNFSFCDFKYCPFCGRKIKWI